MDEPIGRNEYEAFVRTYEQRHAELRIELKDTELELKTQMNSMINKMDTLSNQMNRRSLDVWKLVATSAVSVIAGYFLNYVQHLLPK